MHYGTSLTWEVVKLLFNIRLVYLKSAQRSEDRFNGGFKKNSSTSDNIFLLLGAIQLAKFLQQPLYVVFVDFKCAFDTVNRNMMFYNLVKKSYDGKIIRVLYNMYTKIRSKVCVDGLLSEFLIDTLGVNQASPNSPDMFKDFLSDMGEYLSHSSRVVITTEIILLYLLWADDLILISNTAEGLQRQLNNLQEYCTEWHLIVNTLRTKVMTFGTVQPGLTFQFNCKPVENVQKYKYAGVVFNNNGPIFNEHVTGILDSSSRVVFKVLSYCKSLGQTPPVLAMKLFNTLVSPIMMYGSKIWYTLTSQQLKDKMLRFQLRYNYEVHIKSKTTDINSSCIG